MYILYLITLVILFINHSLAFSEEDFKVKRFSFRNGLPENEVIFIMKDKIGFYWLLTHSGVVRFDGLNFYTFGNEKFENNLKTNFFSCFQINDDIILFISSENQLWKYDYNSGSFYNLTKKISVLNHKFYCGVLTKKNSLLFAVENGLLETTTNFEKIGFYSFDFNSYSKKYPFKPTFIKEDINNNFWMNWFATGLITFDYKKKTFINLLGNEIFESNILNLSSSSENHFLITSTQFGSVIKIRTKDYQVQFIPAKNIFGEKKYAAFYTEAFSDSQLFIGTNTALILLNIFDLSYKVFKHNNENSNSLIGNKITYIFRDNYSWWFATPNGLNIFNSEQSFFRNQKFENIKSIDNKNLEILYTCNYDNLIWYLTIKGLIVLNPSTEKSHYYLNNVSKLPINQMILRYMIKDSDGYFWIATWGDGVIRFKLKRNFQVGDKIDFDFFYSDDKDSSTLSGNFISYLIEDTENNIWISTWGSGLSFLSATEKKKIIPNFKRVQQRQGYNIPTEFIGQMTFDNHKNLLMTSSKGFLRMRKNNFYFEQIYIDKNDSINHINNPQFLAKDNDGGIILASFSGISKIKYNWNNEYQTEIFDIKPPHSLRQLFVDKNGLIWFGTNVSILYSYNREKNQLRRYNISDEVSGFSFDFSYPSMDKQNIYFKSISFSPDSFVLKNFNQKLYLRSVYVNNVEKNFNLDPTRLDKINLSYKENNLKIELSLANSVVDALYEFRYRIKNKSFEWINLNKPELFLASLEPGNYEIEFNASDLNGIWTDENLILSIIISPPFWDEVWFRLLISIILLSVITFNIRSRLKRIKNEKETIQKFTQRLINSQEEERARVSRELHDSVGQNLILLKNMLTFNLKNKKYDNDLLNQFDNMLGESLDELRNISTSLHPHQLRRLGFKLTIEAMLNKLNTLSIGGIKFHHKIEIDNLPEPYDINVYRIIQESVNNVIKHSKAKNCYVHIKKDDVSFVVEIKDDGIGFDISNKSSGLGMVGIRERATLINANLFIHSDEKGTIIKLSFDIK